MNSLFAIALIPPAVLLFVIWRIDKLEKEPIPHILKVAVFGALSGLAAMVIEMALDQPLWYLYGDNYAKWLVVDNFVGVALVEEAVKMAVVMFFIWRSDQFNCLFDGVVYGTATSRMLVAFL